MLTMLDLFSGIGGFSLAASWTGEIETIAFCEIDSYCQKVLKKHWPDVPIYSDIKELNGYELVGKYGAVDIVCGGFPCQPHSVIGKRQGEEDERNLWPEYIRVIKEIKPNWVIGENVNGILYTMYEKIHSEMEKENYEVRTFNIPAYSVGAPHERYRIFIIGHSKDKPRLQAYSETNSKRTQRATREYSLQQFRDKVPGIYWEAHKPPICGVDDGISIKLDGYKPAMMALGNSIVPQVVYPIFNDIVKVERVCTGG